MKSVEELQLSHEALQIGVPDGMMRFTEDITIPYTTESKFGFEFFRWRSPEMVAEMDCFIEHARGKKCFMDVGALHGVFSLVFTALNPDGVAYAIEPHAESFISLCKQINGDEQVIAFCDALSDHDGVLSMGMEWGMHLVAGLPNGASDVPCTTADLFCAGYLIKPDLIKIDVEGHEAHVLRGLKATIADHHPTIFLEIHPKRLAACGEDVQEMLEALMTQGYSATDTLTNEPIGWMEILAKTEDSRIIFT